MEKRIKMRKAYSKIAIFMLILVMTLGTSIVPAFAESISANAIKVTSIGDRSVIQGDTCEVAFTLENLKDEPITYDQAVIKFEDAVGLKVKNGNTGLVTLSKKGDKSEIRFSVEVGRFYETGAADYTFTLKNAGEEVYTSKHYTLGILKYNSTGAENNNYVNAAEIYYSTMPADGFYLGKDNHISFEIFNAGNGRLKNAVLTLTMPAGIGIDNGSTSANIGYISSGDTKHCDFNILVEDEVVTGNYMFTAELSGQDMNGGSANVSKSFYIYINGKEKKDKDDENTDEKNPRLMVSNYQFGANAVEAGSSFTLLLDLQNTAKRNLYNVKVTLSSDGTFVPKGTSNSFYIEKINEKETISRSMDLSVVPDAAQKTTAITVNMSYEDSEGNTHTSDDIISIKVNQKTKLVVDDIVPPYEVYVGNQNGASVDFYNMGNTVLSNLRVNVEGDFDIYESNSYYAGNMQSGSDDSYSFYFVPREVGPMNGNIIFTYDDVEGNSQRIEVPFTFDVMEMPVWDDPWMDEPIEEAPSVPWSIIIFAIALIVLIVGFIIFRKVRKARQAKKLEIEDAAFELKMNDGKEQNTTEDTKGNK